MPQMSNYSWSLVLMMLWVLMFMMKLNSNNVAIKIVPNSVNTFSNTKKW